MKKVLIILASVFLLGTVLTFGGCGWGPWHGHGRGWDGHGPGHNTSANYWHGPQYGYKHYASCGHPGY